MAFSGCILDIILPQCVAVAGALSLCLLLLQLPGPLSPRKEQESPPSPPRSSRCGQGQLEPKARGFHHPTWMLPGPRAWPDPPWALGGAWPLHQPCSRAPVSMARSPGTCPAPLLWGLAKGLWVQVGEPFRDTPSGLPVSSLLYCRNVKISYRFHPVVSCL